VLVVLVRHSDALHGGFEVGDVHSDDGVSRNADGNEGEDRRRSLAGIAAVDVGRVEDVRWRLAMAHTAGLPTNKRHPLWSPIATQPHDVSIGARSAGPPAFPAPVAVAVVAAYSQTTQKSSPSCRDIALWSALPHSCAMIAPNGAPVDTQASGHADTSITMAGFTITTRKLPILKAAPIDEMAKALGITPPEMIFGDNVVRIEHAHSGWYIAFNAFDALDRVDKTGDKMFKVSYSKEWQQNRYVVPEPACG